MKVTRTGTGRPLLLVHGLGSTSRVWEPVMAVLAAQREVIAVDLPGHGGVAAEADSGSFAGVARSLERFLDAQHLAGCDMVGSSLGGQLVLEMARRGKAGATVALDPGGFWLGWERPILRNSLKTALWTARGFKPGLSMLARNPATRTMLLGLLSNQPWALDGELVASEMEAFADTETLDTLIDSLAFGAMQIGSPAADEQPITIGWGRHDRLCNPSQARRALAAFPRARLHWFDHSGHFPMWDEPAAAASLILGATGSTTLH
ncbi:MAG: alpha/beta hydrolase [Alphaproteobacteria bacterium]|nr:alpha/beta hydrolase [Alphaproteobacteria bacterium]